MHPHLFHIYGPLYIQSYGACIALALIIFFWFAHYDTLRKQLLSIPQLQSLLFHCIIAGVVGGRTLFIAQHPHIFTSLSSVCALWEGGFSVLGSLIAIVATLIISAKKFSIPLASLLDLLARYAPLVHSISRIGCFLSGCCYGKPTMLPWAITYTNYLCHAPLYIPLHPTQLYSSLSLLGIFLLLQWLYKTHSLKPGTLACIYLMLAGIERFANEPFRGEASLCTFDNPTQFSSNQWIALCIIISASCALIWIRTTKYRSAVSMSPHSKDISL